MKRCVAALVVLGTSRSSSLETHLVKALPRACLLHVVEAAHYGDTPLRVRLVDGAGLEAPRPYIEGLRSTSSSATPAFSVGGAGGPNDFISAMASSSG